MIAIGPGFFFRQILIKKYPAIKVTVDAIYRRRIAVGSGSDSNMYNIFIVLKDLSTGKKYTISDSEFDVKKCMHVGAIGELHIVREYPDVIQVKDGVLYIHGKSTIFVGSGDLGDGVVHTLKDPKNPIYNLDGENNTKKLPVVIYGGKEIYMKAAFFACSFILSLSL